MKASVFLMATLLFTSFSPEPVEWEKFSLNKDSKVLKSWIRKSAAAIIEGRKIPELSVKTPEFFGRYGLFITLVRKGKVRGCFGAFDHISDSLKFTLKKYISGAIFLDPRYRQIEDWELEDTVIILTVAGRPVPVNGINSIDISRFGVLIECSNRPGTVIVPAEYRTESSLNKIISSNCQIYKFSAVTIK